jgi:hypothetical protein
MANEELTPEQIEQNFNKFRALCERLGDRATKVLKLVDDLGERLAVCPASGRTEYHNCFPGGLVQHSLTVLYNAKVINDTFGWGVSKESLIVSALFHDIGKCAHISRDGECIDYYVPQDSSWHREKLGELYKHNPKIPYMPVAQRSLWILGQYDVPLTFEESVAILIHDGWILDENKRYIHKEPILATILQMADYAATKQEKSASESEC